MSSNVLGVWSEREAPFSRIDGSSSSSCVASSKRRNGDERRQTIAKLSNVGKGEDSGGRRSSSHVREAIAMTLMCATHRFHPHESPCPPRLAHLTVTLECVDRSASCIHGSTCHVRLHRVFQCISTFGTSVGTRSVDWTGRVWFLLRRGRLSHPVESEWNSTRRNTKLCDGGRKPSAREALPKRAHVDLPKRGVRAFQRDGRAWVERAGELPVGMGPEPWQSAAVRGRCGIHVPGLGVGV